MSDHFFTAFKLSFWSILFLICTAVSAPAETVQQLDHNVQQIQKKYRSLVSLSFTFQQRTRSGGRDRTGAGDAVFYRPGKEKSGIMRWNYTEPDSQTILKNGDKLSIYSQRDNQLIITSAKELETDITYAFFAGTRQLLDNFSVQQPDKRFEFHLQDTKLTTIMLIPKVPHQQIKSLQIWFDNSFLLHHLIMEDHFGSITELTFTNISLNLLPADSPEAIRNLTWLNLPENTEIISQ